MFDISDKVVCINDKGLDECAHIFSSLPVEGTVYVVRDMDYSPEVMEPDGVPGVLLVGIFSIDYYDTGTEFCFSADRFIKLDDYKTLLKEKKAKEKELALV